MTKTLYYKTTFRDLKTKWLTARNLKEYDFVTMPHHVGEIKQNLSRISGRGYDAEWVGCTDSQMEEWLHNGYSIPGLSDLGVEHAPIRKRRKLRFDEEGEYQYDLDESGFDYPYIRWEKRDSLPGMRVVIPMAFSAMVNSKIIVEYQGWVLKMLVALEDAGIDCEIAVDITMKDIAPTGRGKTSPWNTIQIVVKEPMEKSDYVGWSAMLSPGGYRCLGFFAKILACDSWNKPIKSGYGSPATRNGNSWDISYDPAEREIQLEIMYSGGNSFPADAMTKKLEDVLKQARK